MKAFPEKSSQSQYENSPTQEKNSALHENRVSAVEAVRKDKSTTLMTGKSIVSVEPVSLRPIIDWTTIIQTIQHYTFTNLNRFQVIHREMSYYKIWASSTYQDVCLSDNSNSCGIELQTTHGISLQPDMPESKLSKITLFILQRRWAKFSPLIPHTLANSILISQPTQIFMINQNHTQSVFMLQWPTNKTATLNKSKNKMDQPTLQWPEEKIATPPKNDKNSQYKDQLTTYTKELSKFNGSTMEAYWTLENKEEDPYFKEWKTKYQQINQNYKV